MGDTFFEVVRAVVSPVGIYLFLAVIAFVIFAGIRIVDQTERGLIQTFGKYTRFAAAGFHWIIPFVQSIIKVKITERMTNIEPQEIITQDNLNAQVDLVVYYKIKSDEASVKASEYEIDVLPKQLETLARTTARNVIGTLPFKEVNSERNKLNTEIQKILGQQTENWGVDVLRVELKDITPPEDVQEVMNKVVKAEKEKAAAVDFATARETEADGKKRAAVKEAEGIKQATILQAEAKKEAQIKIAEGEAAAIKLVNEASDKYFKGNAQILKQLQVTQESLQNNAKIVLTEKGIQPIIVLGDEKVIPIKKKGD